ncbi:MAG: tetratricopeptide repeat protein [Bacteroidota bacterium]|nr:tetratricopeptide repeat protein [Bacteroidota bacterium]
MKKLYFILILVLASISLSAASGNDSLFTEANRHFNEGLYNDAISAYEEILENGVASWELYYNLGNAYFKTNNMGPAIYNYEKALKLNPESEDAKFNLKIANNKITDKIEPVPEFFIKKWWRGMYSMFPAHSWGIISIVLFLGVLILAVVFFISPLPGTKRTAFWTALLLLILTVFSFAAGYKNYHEQELQDEAIVFAPTVTVKSSPNKNAVDLFVLHEGSKLRITDEVDQWYEIRIANGSVGWLPEETVRTF